MPLTARKTRHFLLIFGFACVFQVVRPATSTATPVTYDFSSVLNDGLTSTITGRFSFDNATGLFTNYAFTSSITDPRLQFPMTPANGWQVFMTEATTISNLPIIHFMFITPSDMPLRDESVLHLTFYGSRASFAGGPIVLVPLNTGPQSSMVESRLEYQGGGGQFLNGSATPSTVPFAVPEPASAWLLGLGALLTLRARRRPLKLR